MRKSDLKPGVEYACVRQPSMARRTGRNATVKPFKATLIDLDFNETRMKRRNLGYGYQTVLEPVRVSGIAVDTGTKVTVEGDVPKLDAKGSFVWVEKKEEGVGSARKTVAIAQADAKFEYDYVLLENAGCFISTWADYEVNELAAAEAKKKHENELRAQGQARKDAEPEVKARVKAVLDVLGGIGDVVILDADDRFGKRPDEFHISRSKEEADNPYASILTGDFIYSQGPDKEYVLTGLRFGSHGRGGSLSLDAMEAIIKAAKEVQ
jgi:hypothetical protein